MGAKRRRFTREYRQDAASQVIDCGQAIVGVAKSLGLCEQTLGKWVKDERKRRFVESVVVNLMLNSYRLTMNVFNASWPR